MANTPPTVINLSGDRRLYLPGSGTLAIDVGADAVVSDPDPHGYVVRRVAFGLSNPLFSLEVPDGSGRMFVVEKTGAIRIVDPATGAVDSTPFLDISGQVATSGEQGLLGFALAPDFATSRTFYVYLTNLSGDNELRRYTTLAGNPDQASAASADRILLIPHPTNTNHNGGWIGFGPDGMLYLAVGDGAFSANAQNNNTLLGKILRIDPRTDSFPGDADRDYAIPSGNPFAGPTAGADEIWATGLRNPFRASFDPLNGNLFIGDVGQNVIEEIDIIPAGQGGLNFGWDRREGTQPFGGADSPAFTPPVAEYGHGSGPFQGNSVTGGIVYRGPIAGLTGQYIFGDFFNKLWSLPADSLVNGTTQPSSAFTLRNTAFTPDTGSVQQITSFATDAAGNIYITDLGGELFRIQQSATPNFAGGSLRVSIGEGKLAAQDRLGFVAGAGVTLSNATNVGSIVSVDGVAIGAIAPGGTGSGADDLVILFNSNADAARTTALLRAVAYSNVGAPQAGGARTLTYTLNDGAGTATGGSDTTVFTSFVSVAFNGSAGNDSFTGNAGPDTFLLQQGGADQAVGGAGDDGFYFGAAFGQGDVADGGAGADDQLALRGVYNLTMPAGALIGIETLALLSGSDARFEAAGPAASYNLFASESNIPAGGVLTVNANGLLAGEGLTFDGSAESDGSFRFFAGLGAETLTGGSGSDGFFFGESGRFNPATLMVSGGPGGDDQLALRGDYSALQIFAAATMQGVETLALLSAKDVRFGAEGSAYSYNLRLADGNVMAGATLIVSATGLAADESLTLDGSLESNGFLSLRGGAGADVLTGGALGDTLFGGLGADSLAGGGGADIFLYRAVAESSAAAPDTIGGFAAGDRIDLSIIDAISGGADDAFQFIGTAAFNAPGQLRAEKVGGFWVIQANVTGAGDPELVVSVATADPNFVFGAGDFVL